MISIEIMILLLGFAALWYYKQKIIGNKLKNSISYSDYLRSEKWENLRRSALERADYKCELCSSPYKAIHHVTYPKRYNDDHIDNLVVVCDKCHSKLHGVRDEKKIVFDQSLYSEEVKAGSRIYQFHIKTYNNIKILCIKESGKIGEHQIEVSEDILQRFSANLKSIFDCMSDNSNLSRRFEEKLLADDCTYFFDLKLAINQNKYIKITEARRVDNRVFERDYIMIFEDGVKLFDIGFYNALKFMRY